MFVCFLLQCLNFQFWDQSHVTEVLFHHRHPQSPRAPDEPPHTTCWSESSSGCGHVAGPTSQILHRHQQKQTVVQTRERTLLNTDRDWTSWAMSFITDNFFFSSNE